MYYSHTPQDIDNILAAMDERFDSLGKAITEDKVDNMLPAPVCEVVFKRRLV